MLAAGGPKELLSLVGDTQQARRDTAQTTAARRRPAARAGLLNAYRTTQLVGSLPDVEVDVELGPRCRGLILPLGKACR